MRYILAVTLTVTLGLFVAWAPTAAEQLAVSRDGVTEVAAVEVGSLMATITMDSRYEALRQVAEERGFTLALARAAVEISQKAIGRSSFLRLIVRGRKKGSSSRARRCGPSR